MRAGCGSVGRCMHDDGLQYWRTHCDLLLSFPTSLSLRHGALVSVEAPSIRGITEMFFLQGQMKTWLVWIKLSLSACSYAWLCVLVFPYMNEVYLKCWPRVRMLLVDVRPSSLCHSSQWIFCSSSQWSSRGCHWYYAPQSQHPRRHAYSCGRYSSGSPGRCCAWSYRW